ncbi:MAG: hypothetical protein A2Y77_05295 [Planctomycetes bacterium RBG_13_62_9]|nr:MAG: hypothetical protein A2Y77_05295 [Planctomycetes bacterium RBG_13_62_9]
MSVRFEFTHTRFLQKTQTLDIPSDTESWDWSGSVVLESGAPQIVSAVQDSDTAIFLLLTAHVPGE